MAKTYKAKRHVRLDGKLYAPGKALSTLTEEQAKHLLETGAVEAAKAPAPKPEPKPAPKGGGKGTDKKEA